MMALCDNVGGGISGLLGHSPSFDTFAVLLGKAWCGKQGESRSGSWELESGEEALTLSVLTSCLAPWRSRQLTGNGSLS